MPDFELTLLDVADGTWDEFKTDWAAQCDEVGEPFEEYAAETLKLLAGVLTGTLTSVGGDNTTRIAALKEIESGRFYACCMLNRTRLPSVVGRTLRVRHLIVSPLLDYGVAEVEMYPDVVIGVMLGIVYHSSGVLAAENIHLHLRSPEDMAFFRIFGQALHGANQFASVQTRGSWLYLTKTDAGNAASSEEAE